MKKKSRQTRVIRISKNIFSILSQNKLYRREPYSDVLTRILRLSKRQQRRMI